MKITHLEQILQGMADKSIICQSSIRNVLNDWPDAIISVNRKNLRRAILGWGTPRTRQFFAYLLGWDQSLVEYLSDMEYKAWRKLGMHRRYQDYDDLAASILSAAILAYIKEYEKP